MLNPFLGKTDTMVKMRSVSVSVLCLLSLVVAGIADSPASSGRGAAGPFAVVSERPGAIELSIEPVPEGADLLRRRRFYVAVPFGANALAEQLGGTFETRELRPEEQEWFERTLGTPDAGTSTGWFPRQPVVVSGPFTYRNTRVVAVDCYFSQFDVQAMTVRDWTGYRVAVRYPAPGAGVERRDVDPFVADLVVNSEIFPPPALPPARSAGQGGADPHFSKSQNWIRIEVEKRGIYAITGADLLQVVPSRAVIDPSTFRLFTGSGFEQKRDLTDPDASWRPGNWMRETAIQVDGEGDGVFDVGDRIVFYAVGAEGWLDQFDASKPDTVYYTHGRATKNYYYLTWGGNFSGPPLRMSSVAAAPSAGADRSTFRERVYVEKNKVSDYDYGGDFWLWEKFPRDSTSNDRRVLDRVDIVDLVTGVPQVFRTVALAPYTGKVDKGIPLDIGHHARYENTPAGSIVHTTIGDYRWDSPSTEYSYEDGRPVRFDGNFLFEGINRLDLVLPRDDNRRDWMYFAWLSLFYERRLHARDDRLGFASPDTVGSVNFRVTGFGSSGNLHVFEVSDRFAVRSLTGLEVGDAGGGTRRVRFASSLGGQRAHFWATSDAGMMEVASLRQFDATDLRNVTTSPQMLIVTTPVQEFRTAAERLASFRRSHLGRLGTGTVKVVTTDEIYDNFSGGQTDPFAIRNYIKFLYELDGGGAPTLAYVLLFGDANMDFKYHASNIIDRVPTFVHDIDKMGEETFATDEWYYQMDASDQILGHGAGDVGLGRLPASSGGEADALVDKVIGYETDAPVGEWRNQVILVADDEAPPGHACEPWFTSQSERIAKEFVPDYVDVRKIYLSDYPSLAGPKPASRLDLLDMWNSGAVILHYVGHGSSVQLADEIVFVDDDVPKLNNGLKLPVFMAMSCTVGDFANPSKKCLSEELVLKRDGGAIGTVTSSALSGVFTNEWLSYGLFNHLLPRKPGDPVALGEDVMRAKLESISRCDGGYPCDELYNQELNNWKYNLLGDPSLRIKAPQQEIALTPEGPDTLVAGVRRKVYGRVMHNGSVDTSFEGSVTVRVHEPNVYKTAPRCGVGYYLRGGTIYRGTTDVVDGEFSIDFRVPRYAKPGKAAFLTAYAAQANGLDAGASFDSTFTLALPALADSLALIPIDGAPRVQFGFKSGLKVVKPGESLQAIIHDQDGVNILNTTAEGRHALLIDDAPVPFDVTRFFEFDYGGTDTSGVMTYPLPELTVGGHRAILRVSDSFAQTTLDTLEFAVTDPLDYFAEVVMNYPNPFETETQFLIRLSNRASIRLDIFTVSGKRIRRLEAVRDGGEEWIAWDGRDHAGDEIANGTYLYVATVDFAGVDRPALVLRGKLTKIQ
jgi:hypothetical protein